MFEWQPEEEVERRRELCEVHFQMEMTGRPMTGRYCVIVASRGWIGVPAII